MKGLVMIIENKIILVTGGNSGIGSAIVEKTVGNNNIVIACGRNIERLNALKTAQPSVKIIQCDIQNSNNVAELISNIQTEYGHIDILFNNAAIFKELDFQKLNFDSAAIEEEINTNFTSQVKLIYAFLPLLKKSNDAAIVNITSGYGLSPAKRAPVYSATKSAMHSFSQSLRSQLEGTSIKVFEAILPLVDTPSTQDNPNPKMSAETAALEILSGVRKNKNEIYVGILKWLPFLLRVAPKTAAKKLLES